MKQYITFLIFLSIFCLNWKKKKNIFVIGNVNNNNVVNLDNHNNNNNHLEEQLGRHLIVEMMGSPYHRLNNITFIDNVFREACTIGSLTLLKMQLHQFEPFGVSGVAVLAESHISIHTWPEKSYAALDIFVCGKNANPELALKYIEEQMEATSLNVKTFDRGIPKLPMKEEL